MWKQKFIIDGEEKEILISLMSWFTEPIDVSAYQDRFKTYLPGLQYLELTGTAESGRNIHDVYRVIGRTGEAIPILTAFTKSEAKE